MKNLKHSIYTASILLAACSCSSETTGIADKSTAVEFRISIPGLSQTRSDGDNLLKWSVFEIKEGEPKTLIGSDEQSFTLGDADTSVPITLQLMQGRKYQVAFAFVNTASTFAGFEDGMVSVDYSNMANNTAADDIFIGKSDVLTVAGESIEAPILLSRPFAQLNWLTSDMTEKQVSDHAPDINATVTVSGDIYTSFDIIEDSFGGKIDNALTFSSTQLSDVSCSPDDNGFCNIANNYLLIKDSEEQPTIDCSLQFGGYADVAVNVNSAPVKPNYRTNISGALLTNSKSVEISMQEAFSNSSFSGFTDDDIIENILAGEHLVIDKGKTVDLRRFEGIPLKAGQSITVDGTLLVGRNTFVVNQPGDPVTLTGSGTITLSDISSNVFEIGSDGSLDISNVTFSKINHSDDGIYLMMVNGGNLNAEKVNFTIDTGVLRATDTANVNLTECKVTTKKYGSYPLYINSGSKCCLQDCNFMCNKFMTVSDRDTELTIKGNNSNFQFSSTCVFNFINNCSVKIEGGKFKCNSYLSLNVHGNLILTGGYYSKPINSSWKDEWVPEGYELISNSTTYSGYPYEVRKIADAE